MGKANECHKNDNRLVQLMIISQTSEFREKMNAFEKLLYEEHWWHV